MLHALRRAPLNLAEVDLRRRLVGDATRTRDVGSEIVESLRVADEHRPPTDPSQSLDVMLMRSEASFQGGGHNLHDAAVSPAAGGDPPVVGRTLWRAGRRRRWRERSIGQVRRQFRPSGVRTALVSSPETARRDRGEKW